MPDKGECEAEPVSKLLHYDCAEGEFLIHLIDSIETKNTDLSEAAPLLHTTDGLVLVIDCVEGMSTFTDMLLHRVTCDQIQTVLMLNKVDRMLLELQLSPEEIYQSLFRTVSVVSSIDSDTTWNPANNEVCFGSALHSWAFTLGQFAERYSSKFGIDTTRMTRKLWGDNFFSPTTRKWYRVKCAPPPDGSERAFCMFIMQPLQAMFEAVMNRNTEMLEKMLKAVNITLTPDEMKQQRVPLLKCVMGRFFPVSDTVLHMVVTKLPSPKESQAHRARRLYTGSDDKYCDMLRTCDPEAPLLMYITCTRSYVRGSRAVFGRVFSGKLSTGSAVRVMGDREVFTAEVSEVFLMSGSRCEAIEEVPCGNVLCLKFKGNESKFARATVTDATITDCQPLRGTRHCVLPVVYVTVEPFHQTDLGKLLEGLKHLAHSYPLAQCSQSETGTHVIAAGDERHLTICVAKKLKDASGVLFRTSDPMVSLRETISRNSRVRTVNGHNSVGCSTEQLGEDLCRHIEENKMHAGMDTSSRARVYADRFDWDVPDTKRVWCFGPDLHGPNVLVDMTRGVHNMHELRDSFTSAWSWVTSQGQLCEEPLRGVQMDITDIATHADAPEGSKQMYLTAKKSFFECCRASQPRLMEPVFLSHIRAAGQIDDILHVLQEKRCTILGSESGPQVFDVRAYLPVAESFRIVSSLRCNLRSYSVQVDNVFDHWQHVNGDPLVSGGHAFRLVNEVRLAKGMAPLDVG
eukprot:TRINITY_DN6510_c0_g1_i2.p1 TRINITY_DN6510_c0_g1~~TRINITY_DN6510_c0_g1_i2.p1  ORF type:complete len:742 (+),score=136.39 TRINITY_DN6510_c0_g1_i2:190-2415(+)